MEKNNCSEKMNLIIEIIKKRNNGECSFLVLDEEYNKNDEIFNRIFNILNYDFELGQSTRALLEVLYSDLPHFTKKLELYNRLSPDITGYFPEYMISYYCIGRTDAYYDFTKLIYYITKKLMIFPYNKYSYEEMSKKLYEYFDYKQSINTGKIKIEEKIIDGFNVYKNYPDYSKLGKYKFNFLDTNDLFVYSEFDTCRFLEWQSITENNRFKPIWVSRDRGDGYGFDVLYYDTKNNTESLIEVKSSIKGELALTENEYLTAIDTCNYSNSDYFIHFYNYNFLENKINKIIYKYDKEKKLFVDINTNQEYYCELIQYTDENNEQKTKYAIKPIELKKEEPVKIKKR